MSKHCINQATPRLHKYKESTRNCTYTTVDTAYLTALRYSKGVNVVQNPRDHSCPSKFSLRFPFFLFFFPSHIHKMAVLKPAWQRTNSDRIFNLVLLSVQRVHHVSKLTTAVQIINVICVKNVDRVHKQHITVKPLMFVYPLFC